MEYCHIVCFIDFILKKMRIKSRLFCSIGDKIEITTSNKPFSSDLKLSYGHLLCLPRAAANRGKSDLNPHESPI